MALNFVETWLSQTTSAPPVPTTGGGIFGAQGSNPTGKTAKDYAYLPQWIQDIMTYPGIPGVRNGLLQGIKQTGAYVFFAIVIIVGVYAIIKDA